jgi:hypothetical protein
VSDQRHYRGLDPRVSGTMVLAAPAVAEGIGLISSL